MRAVLLNSGGKDSLAAAIILSRAGYELHSLFCIAGQKALEMRDAAAKKIAEKYCVSHDSMVLNGEWQHQNKFGLPVTAHQTLLFLILAATWGVKHDIYLIASGIKPDAVTTNFPEAAAAYFKTSRGTNPPGLVFPVFDKSDDEIFTIVRHDPLWRNAPTCPYDPACGSCVKCKVRKRWITLDEEAIIETPH
jgi:7-cyano-7-deazaguanine synthase in queuosine biosynthesis